MTHSGPVTARWLTRGAGACAIVLGALLLFRPVSSLALIVLITVGGLLALAVGEFTGEHDHPRWARARAVAWLGAALVLVAWPDVGVRGLAIMVGLSLVVDGAIGLVAERRYLTGLASVILGALALGWPDVTLIVLSALFAIRLLRFGLSQFITVPSTRWWSKVKPGLALGGALVLLLISLTFNADKPHPDAFYDAPAPVPSAAGVLLRSEPFTRQVPAGARAWRILYTTTRADGVPAVASAIVLVPEAASAAPRPVVAWAHGTTGYARGCAPSLLSDPFEAGATPALSQVVRNGWAMVATDYVGLGTAGPHPYLIGQGEGRSVLDAVKAAHDLPGVSLSQRTAIWGHSQGGHAALWAGQLAPTYAPDLDLVGVAALAPASDLTGLVANLTTVRISSVFASYVLQAYADTYPDVSFDHYVRATARIPIREMATRCLDEPEVFVSALSALLFGSSPWSRDPASGALGRRLAENTPVGTITAPLLIAQGEADTLVRPSMQQTYVEGRRARGGAVDYRTYPGQDHIGLVDDRSPLIADLLAWTTARFGSS
ncbi:lipase family protein [Nocardioides sp.]|uniref:lipase family protein n=1 Tax=Nocardioides sp. TaxID=35761 RepID=UPI002631D5F7|nr:lipase family protein [Nocardioides sp.]